MDNPSVGLLYWTGAPRPSQKLTNCASCGSEAVSTGRRCAQASATSPLVPGRRAPVLVTEDAVRRMKPGSVIVDLAGEAGGNCELSEPGESVIRHGVKILAPLNVPSTMAEHASQLYARNVQALLELMTEDGELKLDFEDEVIAGACITREGEIVHEGARQAAGAATST